MQADAAAPICSALRLGRWAQGEPRQEHWCVCRVHDSSTRTEQLALMLPELQVDVRLLLMLPCVLDVLMHLTLTFRDMCRLHRAASSPALLRPPSVRAGLQYAGKLGKSL